jgi:Fe-S-cluster-containing dehydrogenase component/DMSO reductase anchor subunit
MVLPSLSRFVGAPLEGSPAQDLARALADQGNLTAADTFSQWHDTRHASPGVEGKNLAGSDSLPALAGWYRELLPSEPASPGKPYAFEVDLDKCSGCKACVTACHNLNGLDEGETWREVGLLGSPSASGSLQHLTSACHHCMEPGCSDGCPTRAYEKDTITGIVRHLDDQCMGCQYCSLKCPYDVPRFHGKKGIVRKCDMCYDRLAQGEAPACVQACPTKAIRITLVDVEALLKDAQAAFPIAAPSVIHTLPTTRYIGATAPAKLKMVAADSRPPVPEHAHLPLAIMLPLSQAAIGYWILLSLVQFTHPFALSWPALILGQVLNVAFLVTSVFHLGRPLVAWKAFLGWRKSWLSREAIVFGVFAGMGGAQMALAAVNSGLLFKFLPISFLANLPFFQSGGLHWATTPLAFATAFMGMVGLYASSMVYRDTPRPQWATVWTTTRFVLSAISLGGIFMAGIVACNVLMNHDLNSELHLGFVAAAKMWIPLGLAMTALAQALKPWVEKMAYRDRIVANGHLLTASRKVLAGPLAKAQSWRLRLGWGLGVLAPSLLLGTWAVTSVFTAPLSFGTLLGFTSALTLIAVALTCVEVLERTLFFRAAVAPRMPGVAPQ